MANWRNFPGSGSTNISVTDPIGLSVTSAWTFGCWVKPDSLTNGKILMNYGSVDTNSRGFKLVLNPDTSLRLQISAANLSTTGVLVTGSWQTVGVAKQSAGASTWTVGVNGTEYLNQYTGTAPTATTAGDPFEISSTLSAFGYQLFDGGSAWAFWLHNVALSAPQMNSYLNNPQSLVADYGPSGTIIANALKLLWPMQCDTALEEDVSGVGNSGTRNGTAPLELTGGPSPTTEWNPCARARNIIQGTPQIFQDNFNRANGDAGTNYQYTSHSNGTLSIVSNAVRFVGSDRYNIGYVSTGSVLFDYNQESQATFTALFNSDLGGVAVRAGTHYGHYVVTDGVTGTDRRLALQVSGSRTVVGTNSYVFSVGDTIKLRASASTIMLYRNNVLLDTVTDTLQLGGQPGIAYLRGNIGGTYLDNFIANSLPTNPQGTLGITVPSGSGTLITISN